MFATPASAFALFDWLRATFNGDLFPMDDPGAEREQLTSGHLELIRDFVEGRSLIPERYGQGRLLAGTGWLPPILRTERPAWLAVDEQPEAAAMEDEALPETDSAETVEDEPFPVAAE